MDFTSHMVRAGRVTAVDKPGKRVRCQYPDTGVTSGWLAVLQHPNIGVSTTWLPKVNDLVLVLYVPILNGDGYVLGVIG